MRAFPLTPPLFLVCALVLGPTASAQVNTGEDVPIVTRTHALVNARVVQAPGRVLERATVVIRDGLILDVSPDAVVPFDAETVAADSLTVYAGFIDGLSHVGLPTPKEDPDRERPRNPAFPPNDEAGIQPDRDVRSMLNAQDKSIEALRNAGFTAAHVVPRGRMLPGSGAVILLGSGDANALSFRGDVSVFAQLSPARRMYPGTDMAVLAKWRQLYREAARRQRVERLYAEDPTGLVRPSYDPVHYALFPVLGGDKPVYFHTEDVLDLHRVLALQTELGFPVVIAGLEGSFDAVDKLRAAGHPLMLTVDLPDEAKKSLKPEPSDSTKAQPADAADALPEAADPDYDPMLRVRSHADVEAERKNLEARRERERAKYLKTAASLHDAGLTFGFSTLGAKPADVLKNVRTMVENGLPSDAALAALTTATADILGVSESMGTVDPGKLGNLVVTTGPLFDSETRVHLVFVDGEKFAAGGGVPSQSDTAATANPAGTWSYAVESPDGAVDGTVTIAGGGGNWTGVITNAMMPGAVDLDDIILDGHTLSFSFRHEGMGVIEMEATISDDDFSGTVTTPGMGSFPVTGTRTLGPQS